MIDFPRIIPGKHGVSIRIEFAEREWIEKTKRVIVLHGPVAQLDRVLASEAKGWWFESTRDHHDQFLIDRALSSVPLIKVRAKAS